MQPGHPSAELRHLRALALGQLGVAWQELLFELTDVTDDEYVWIAEPGAPAGSMQGSPELASGESGSVTGCSVAGAGPTQRSIAWHVEHLRDEFSPSARSEDSRQLHTPQVREDSLRASVGVRGLVDAVVARSEEMSGLTKSAVGPPSPSGERADVQLLALINHLSRELVNHGMDVATIRHRYRLEHPFLDQAGGTTY